jgi:hypothetical protein
LQVTHYGGESVVSHFCIVAYYHVAKLVIFYAL